MGAALEMGRALGIAPLAVVELLPGFAAAVFASGAGGLAVLTSTIGAGGAKVHTVEHLMSACAGLGIDNLYESANTPLISFLNNSIKAIALFKR